MIKFNQKSWIKPYVEEKQKNIFEKKIFRFKNNAGFGKIIENVRKHRNGKLLKTEREKNYLVLEPNYHTTKIFMETFLALLMGKA